MTNDISTTPKKNKSILAALCCVFGVLSLCAEGLYPFIFNFITSALHNGFSTGFDIVLTFLTFVAAAALLVAAVALFIGKQGALLYVPVFIAGGVYCARYYLNAITLINHVSSLDGGNFKDLVSRFMDYGFLTLGNMFAGLAFIVLGVWLILAAKGKCKKLWMLIILPFAFSCFFLMLDSAYLLYWVIVNPGLDIGYTTIMTSSFINAAIGFASVLLFTLCAFFTCLNIKKNS